MPSIKKRILCVEDDPDNCAMIAALLRLAGYDVITASSVAEALKMAEHYDFDLYLPDRRLPDGDGIELCKEIRASDSKIPIVFYSAHAYAGDKQSGLDAGAQAYLTKPAHIDELERTIAALITNM
jgi:two-component system, OmpR family, response regulator